MRTRTEVRSTHLRSFRLSASRVALVPDQAVLLAGDRVEVSLRVAAGATLEVVEPGGTVAYAMRGDRATWDVRVEMEDGGTLVWDGRPFVVAAGADVRRTLTVDVAGTATVSLRETLVLGRADEPPGLLHSTCRVRRDGRAVLIEELDSRTGLGPHRVVDQVLHLGVPCAALGDHTMVLESGDTLHRWLGAATHLSPVREVCQSPAQSPAQSSAQSSASPEYATTPRFSARTTSRAESRSAPSPAASAT